MERTYKIAIKRASGGNWRIKYTKNLDSFVKNVLTEHKTIVLNIDPGAKDFYPDEKVDIAITIADFYLG